MLGWGRDDVRAREWSGLDKIISAPAFSRSANDQLVYSWFQSIGQQQQIEAAQDAVNEYLKWSGHRSITDDSGSVNSGYRHVIVPAIRGGVTVMDDVFGAETTNGAR